MYVGARMYDYRAARRLLLLLPFLFLLLAPVGAVEDEEISRRFPWEAAVLKNGVQCCNGVLFSDRHVLTTARCVDGNGRCGSDVTSLKVLLRQKDSSTSQFNFSVKTLTKHENFNHDVPGMGNIAILKLETSVPSDKFTPAVLNRTDGAYDTSEPIATGYVKARLEGMTVSLWDRTKCTGVVNSTERHEILDNFLCTPTTNARKVIAGSPLQVRASSGKWEVIGIVSHNYNRHLFKPIVHVKISKYWQWIQQTTEGDWGRVEPLCSSRENLEAPRSWPWMAALRSSGTTFCGGVLLPSGRHVLTAAHCVDVKDKYGRDKEYLTVQLCTYDNTTNKLKLENYDIQEYRQHEDFIYGHRGKHDIAILGLKKNVPINHYIKPAKLPQSDEPYNSQENVVLVYRGKRLEEVPVRLWNRSDCHEAANRPERREVLDNLLCSNISNGQKTIQKGDSGGPVLTLTPDGDWEVIGIVSYKDKSEGKIKQLYMAFTKVVKYLHWIHEKEDSSVSEELKKLIYDPL